jgi:RNA polymerase sigma factor (TIGR02999 family)
MFRTEARFCCSLRRFLPDLVLVEVGKALRIHYSHQSASQVYRRLGTMQHSPNGGPMTEVTRILSAVEAGDAHAAEQLLPLVYAELRKLAAVRMAAESPGQTLTATALVHEAYLRLVGGEQTPNWNSRGHFFAAAAEAMRRILVESARRKSCAKHGGEHQRIELDPVQVAIDMPVDQLLALDEALTGLAERDAQTARLVNLHCFAGLSIEQAAEVLGISTRTAYRDWAFAQAWLFRAVHGTETVPEK